MSIRAQFRLLVVIWFVGGMIAGLLAMYVNIYFLALLFILLVVIAFLSLNLTCPNCKRRVLLRWVKIPGLKIPFCISWIPKRCYHCQAVIE